MTECFTLNSERFTVAADLVLLVQIPYQQLLGDKDIVRRFAWPLKGYCDFNCPVFIHQHRIGLNL